jgi:uncharacterized protein YkwD
MKIYLSVLVQLLFTISVYCQNIDYSNFDYKTFETKVVEKINEYRKSIGLKQLNLSQTLKSYTSDKTSSDNSKNDLGKHLQVSKINDTINLKLYQEIYKYSNGKCGSKEPSNIFINEGFGEIISICEGKYSTYDELAIKTLNGWLNSPGHKKIIETPFLDLNGYSGLISCCSKFSKSNKLYTTVNFVSVSSF